jgi:hypothetical protein
LVNISILFGKLSQNQKSLYFKLEEVKERTMSKLVLIVGILLIVVSVPILLVGIMDTENSPIGTLLKSTACNPPEKLVSESTYYSMPNGESGQNFTYFCEIEPGQRRDVSDKAFIVIAGSFVIPFGLGMLFTMVGATGVARNKSRKLQESMGDYFNTYPQAQGTGLGGQTFSGSETVIDLRGNKGDIPPQAQQILNSVLSNFPTATVQTQGDTSLSERLKQLEEAYENDLITAEEYNTVRQAILDSLDD